MHTESYKGESLNVADVPFMKCTYAVRKRKRRIAPQQPR